MTKGQFITFEGGDGAGKTTLINKIAALLTGQGHQVITTREPGGTPLGEEIRRILLAHSSSNICSKAELLLFLASRAQHIHEKIAPSLEQGKIVLCDRFNDSSIIYQGIGRNLGLDYAQSLSNLACGDLIPDLTIFLDVSPESSMKRTEKGSTKDRIESEDKDFHQKIRNGYAELQKQEPLRIQTINGNQPIESVYNQARVMVTALLEMVGNTSV